MSKSNKHSSGMQKLGDNPALNALLHSLNNRERTEQASKQHQELLDFRHLNAENLEAENIIYPSSAFYQAKQLPYCGRCDNGWIATIKDGSRASAKCQHCQIPRQRLRRLNDLKLPADARDAHFGMYQWDNTKQQQRVQSMQEWMLYGQQDKPQSPSVYMYGTAGNGKTTLLYALAKWAVFNDYRVLYTSHNRTVDAVKRSFNTKSSDAFLSNWLNGVELLLFDELCGIGGKANMTDWYKGFTSDMIGAIYESWGSGQLSIVMTTNLTPRDVYLTLDRNDAIMSRLYQMFGDAIQMTGKDRRAPSAALKSWGVY
jgi:DNA replication protein DnaC